MKKKEKRERCQNFTLQEEDILISLVEQYKDVVESKKIDGKSCKEKTAAWEKIQEAFCIHTNTYRTAKMLREKYENMKKKVKLLRATAIPEDAETPCSCSQFSATTVQRLVNIISETASPADGEDITEEVNGAEAWNGSEAEVLNVTPEIQILTHETWSPPRKSKKSLRLNKAKKRKMLNTEKSSLRVAKSKMKFFKNEELRAAERHSWERELNAKRSKWEEELHMKKMELLNVQIEKEKYQIFNITRMQ